MNLALIAHDRKKNDMILLAREFSGFLSGCKLMATGTTGVRLMWSASGVVLGAAICKSVPGSP